VALVPVDSATPSPFSSTLLFSYVGNFLYDGDAPLAERRAQALVLDQAELRSLLGEAELRQLFDAETIESAEREYFAIAYACTSGSTPCTANTLTAGEL